MQVKVHELFMIQTVSKYTLITMNQNHSLPGLLISGLAAGVRVCVHMQSPGILLYTFQPVLMMGWAEQGQSNGNEHNCPPVPGVDSGTFLDSLLKAILCLDIDLGCLLCRPNALFSHWENAKRDYRPTLAGHKAQAMHVPASKRFPRRFQDALW